MQEIIDAINSVTDAIPDSTKVASMKPEARDWSAFFSALGALALKLLPIILPLLVTPKPVVEAKPVE